jgi:ketosteroid isomerase-like protein
MVEPVEAKGKGDRVFLWVHFSGHGRESGAPAEGELAHVLTMRDGKVARIAEYSDRQEALEASGLRG